MALLIEADINPGTFAAIFAYEPPLLTPQDRLDVIAAYSKGTAGPRLDEMARRRKKRFDSRESARERLGKKMSTFDPRVFDLYLKHGLKPVAEVGVEVELACNPIIEEDIYLVMDPPPTSHNLRYISCPVTIAVGDMSEGPHARLINGSVSIHKSLRASRSKLIRFKGISHFGPFERPEVVAEAIKEAFLIRSRI